MNRETRTDANGGTGTPVAKQVAEKLRRLVDLVQAGEVDASPRVAAYLAGVADGLDPVGEWGVPLSRLQQTVV